MKKNILTVLFALLICVFRVSAQETAKLTLVNKTDYTLTIKIMLQNGTLYNTVFLIPRTSKTMLFSSSGDFYTKIKAESTLETLYKQGRSFQVYCSSGQYSVSTLTFEISSYGSSLGSSISKTEFERN